MTTRRQQTIVQQAKIQNQPMEPLASAEVKHLNTIDVRFDKRSK